MKKKLPLAIATLGLLTFGSLTSCQDEDFDVSTTVLQDRAFEQAFIKEFGKPSADQTWDFYAQKMQSIRRETGLTRATQAITVTVDTTISQPTGDYFTGIVNEIGYALEEQHDNSTVGTNSYTLTSTGAFKIYAVRYAGAIETGNYKLDFGIAYIDDKGTETTTDDEEIKVNIFGPGYRNQAYRDSCYAHNTNGWGNPGKAAEVTIPEGQQFYFYLSYDYTFTNNSRTYTQTFYSNAIPSFRASNGTSYRTYNGTGSYPYYGGTSTLLYSAEYINEETHMDEQIMMIGFEDAWGHNGNGGTQSGWLDYDFNDIVVFIEGELPLPSSKRFFVEDKTSYDWDYNDVVFDVSNTGIVLRAVGGTLPVFLRVTNRLNQTETTKELHELMREKQFNASHKTKKLTYKREEDGELKTFYKPIDVAGYAIYGKEDHGIWLDPVQIIRWENLGTATQHTRLDADEVEKFGSDPSFPGKAELIVLSEYSEDGYDLSQISQLTAFGPLGDDSNYLPNYKIVEMTPPGGIPAMWTGLVSANWMMELQKITLGYKNFYGGKSEGGTSYQWWETDKNPGYFYDYYGDEPDDD